MTSSDFCGNKNGGEGEIRTHGTASRSVDFESTAFDHSATSPRLLELFYYTGIWEAVNHLTPSVAAVLSRIKRVRVIESVKRILILHPSDVLGVIAVQREDISARGTDAAADESG